MPCNHFSRHTKPRGNKPVLAVTVRRLVEIHKVHIDLFVGDLAVVLRRKWQYGFWRSTKPLIHILEGLNVWHQVISPAHLGS